MVVVIGGGVVLASRIWDPLWNPFRPDPEEVLDSMFEKMRTEDSVHYKMEMSFVGKSGGEESRFSFAATGKGDSSDENNPRVEADFTLAASEAGNQEIALKSSLKGIGQDAYINLKEIGLSEQDQSLLLMLGLDLNQITNQWIKLSDDFQVQETEQSKRMIEEITALLEEKDMFDVKKEFSDEKVEGKGCYHYLLSLNKENFKEVVSKVYETSFEGTQAAFMAGEMSEQTDLFIEKIGGIEMDVWVGKKNDLFKIALSKDIKGEDIGEPAGDDASLSAEMTFFDFGKKAEIEAPQDFKGIDELFSPMILAPPSVSAPENE